MNIYQTNKNIAYIFLRFVVSLTLIESNTSNSDATRSEFGIIGLEIINIFDQVWTGDAYESHISPLILKLDYLYVSL